MRVTLEEDVFIGADNAIILKLYYRNVSTDNFELLDMGSVTRITMTIGDVTADSDAGADITGDQNGVLTAVLGQVAGLLPGKYFTKITIYDGAHINGQVVCDSETEYTIQLRVR